jgi:hypothetical protein
MRLERSRTALRQATQAVEELRAAKDSRELFRDRFVSAMGMVQRVGSIIEVETKGHRTAEFGMWWKKTQSEPLFVFMQDVRNAEYKRGERRQVFVQFASASLGLREPPPPDPPPQWEFVGEGKYKGHEVFSLLGHYLAWLREEILPTAERLTT